MNVVAEKLHDVAVERLDQRQSVLAPRHSFRQLAVRQRPDVKYEIDVLAMELQERLRLLGAAADLNELGRRFRRLPSSFVGINKGNASKVRTFTVAFWASPGAIPPRFSTLARKEFSPWTFLTHTFSRCV